MPEPRRLSKVPHEIRRVIAARNAVRDTPSPSQSTRSAGSRRPSKSAPVTSSKPTKSGIRTARKSTASCSARQRIRRIRRRWSTIKEPPGYLPNTDVPGGSFCFSRNREQTTELPSVCRCADGLVPHEQNQRLLVTVVDGRCTERRAQEHVGDVHFAVVQPDGAGFHRNCAAVHHHG